MAPNRQIGRFTLDDLVEERYGAQIWRAVDSTLNREVALWLVAADEALAADLDQSTRTAATVDDRRIVRILDVFTAEDLLVVVTEWSAGEVLRDHLTAPMPPAEAARIAYEISGAIESAHAKGIAHGRLRPSNILVGHDGEVRITGLGIDAVLAGIDPVAGDDPVAADVNGIGSILYACLTARWPDGDVEGIPGAPEVGGPHAAAVADPGRRPGVARRPLRPHGDPGRAAHAVDPGLASAGTGPGGPGRQPHRPHRRAPRPDRGVRGALECPAPDRRRGRGAPARPGPGLGRVAPAVPGHHRGRTPGARLPRPRRRPLRRPRPRSGEGDLPDRRRSRLRPAGQRRGEPGPGALRLRRGQEHRLAHRDLLQQEPGQARGGHRARPRRPAHDRLGVPGPRGQRDRPAGPHQQ